MADAVYIVDKYPENNASGVYINDIVWAQFSEPIDVDTASYYNFTVNERDTYNPVNGTVSVEGVSGNLNNSVVKFIPTNGFSRSTRYTVLVSTGITSENGLRSLDHDYTWFFQTGTTASSGTIGSSVHDLDPSGFTQSGVVTSSPAASGLNPLEVLSTDPEDYETQVSTSKPHIAITFNDTIPSGISLYDYITIESDHIIGN